MGTGFVNSDDLAAHEAYKNFRKFQELGDRLETQAKEMKAELDFGVVDNDLVLIANVAISTSSVLFKKAKRTSSNKVGPSCYSCICSPRSPRLKQFPIKLQRTLRVYWSEK